MRWMLRRQAAFAAGRDRCSVRQSRVVLAPRPWRLFCGRYPADNGDKNAAHRGEHEGNRKTIARGKPVRLAELVVDLLVGSLFLLPPGCGCIRRPAFPAPFRWRGTTKLQNSGENVPRERERVSGGRKSTRLFAPTTLRRLAHRVRLQHGMH